MSKSEIEKLAELVGVTSNTIMTEVSALKNRTTSVLSNGQSVDARLKKIKADIDSFKGEFVAIKALLQTLIAKP